MSGTHESTARATACRKRVTLISIVLCCVSLRPYHATCSVLPANDDVAIVTAPRSSRQLLQRVFTFDCVNKKCLPETLACLGEPDCTAWLNCAKKCSPFLNPKQVALHYPCQVKCMYLHNILYNANATALNTCVIKNNCAYIITLAPKFCLPPKGGPANVTISALTGRYNVLAGANKLVNCEPAQFQFSIPKPGYFTYQEYPSYLNDTVVKEKPYRIVGHDALTGFTTALGTFAGLPHNSTFVVLDVTKGNEYVLLMYCTETDVIRAGYVLGKQGVTGIPKKVRQRFAKKLQDSVWAAYYDFPLSAFCTVKTHKFP